MKIDDFIYRVKEIEGWATPTLKFADAIGDPRCLVVRGEVRNSISTSVSGNSKLKQWKIRVTSKVKAARGSDSWDPGNQYALSLAFSFFPGLHGGRSDMDVENFIKPVIDAIAAGLFCSVETDPGAIERWNYDDSNFNTLLIHRLPDARDRQSEGVAISVSAR